MKNNKFVSIIIPCRNEEKFISGCIDSILEQDYPKKQMEVFIVDGDSKDKTREIVKEYSKKHRFIKLIINEKKFTPFAFNLGIKASKGDIVFFMGAHAKYDSDYISKSVEKLIEYEADNIGGTLKTVAKEDTLSANGITFCLSSFFGAGNSLFRKGVEKPTEVDTVFGGCYKREVFDKIGLFNENLIRSQDIEFNMRLKKSGGKIMIFPDIVAYYYPKSNFLSFFIHNFKDGFWSIYPLKFIKKPLKIRHYIPLLFVLSFFLPLFFAFLGSGLSFLFFQFVVVVYLFFSFFFSFLITIREGNYRYFSVMLFAFAVRHFGYGLGSLWGILTLLKEFIQNKLNKKNNN